MSESKRETRSEFSWCIQRHHSLPIARRYSPNDENTTVLSGLFGLLLGQLFQQHLLHDLLFFDEEGADNANHRA
ncbi:hypothetical protein Ae201684P_004096 [Aphanomyces euteiches]|nr:hypothetical protein Ae201684P_004096 [Aphanomyces euteiches]